MNKITVIISGGVCQDVIGVEEYTLIDYDNLKEEGKTRDEIDAMVDQAELVARKERGLLSDQRPTPGALRAANATLDKILDYIAGEIKTHEDAQNFKNDLATLIDQECSTLEGGKS